MRACLLGESGQVRFFFLRRWDKSRFYEGGTNVVFLAIGGTNVDLIEGGTNVGGTNVGRTNVGGRKVAAPSDKFKAEHLNVMIEFDHILD